MLQAVFFDFNGVLIDDEGVHQRLFSEVCAEEGISISRADYWETYLHMDDRGAFAEALQRAGRPVSSERVTASCRAKEERYARIASGGIPEVPGAAALLRSCAAKYPVAIVSGAIRSEIEMQLEPLRLDGSVTIMVAAEDTARGKPDPEGYLTGLERLGVKQGRVVEPGSCVALEDSPGGLRAARAAGLRTVGVATNYGGAILRVFCDLVAEDLRRLRVEDLERLVD